MAALLWIGRGLYDRAKRTGGLAHLAAGQALPASPNSAQTEAACAGALGVRLGGPAYYFGVLCPKPTIGDAARPIESEDILRANRMLYAASLLALAALCALRAMMWYLLAR